MFLSEYMKKYFLLVLLILLFFVLDIFLIRLFSPTELDDVNPERGCSEELLHKVNILWVIPKFNNQSIAENQAWCDYILSLNKTLGLHGVLHYYKEFGVDKTQEYLDEGIRIFEQCFNQTPTMFKPPQLAISENNKKLIRDNNLILKLDFNQFTHKVYHCEDTGKFSNDFINVF